MAPIFTPDGTEVDKIILPDGSEALEVIAPDGSVVFVSIPDSDLWYSFDEGSGSVLTDKNGDEDGSISDGSWETDEDVFGGQYVNLGSNGEIQVDDGSAETSGWTTDNDLAVAIQIVVEDKLTDNGEGVIWSIKSDDFEGFTLGSGGSSDIAVEYRGNGDSVSFTEPDAPYTLGIFFRWDSDSEDFELYHGDADTQATGGSDPLVAFDDEFHIGNSPTRSDTNMEEGIACFGVWYDAYPDPEEFFNVL